MFLNGDIGKMYKHVVQFIQTGCVLDRAKSTETKPIPARKRKQPYAKFQVCGPTLVWIDAIRTFEVSFL